MPRKRTFFRFLNISNIQPDFCGFFRLQKRAEIGKFASLGGYSSKEALRLLLEKGKRSLLLIMG